MESGEISSGGISTRTSLFDGFTNRSHVISDVSGPIHTRTHTHTHTHTYIHKYTHAHTHTHTHKHAHG